MKVLFYQILIVLLLFLNPFNSVVNFILGYGLLYLGYRKLNPLNPVLWLSLAWNILFINAFSGIIEYNLNVDIFLPLLYSIFFLSLFLAGFFVNKLSLSNSANINLSLKSFFSKLKFQKKEKIFILFSFLSLLSAILMAAEIVFLYGGNIMDPNSLRGLFSTREATILSQLSGILFFGGLFSIPAFLFFENSKFRLWYLIGILSFTFGSILSAGRQMVFQMIIASIICLLVMKFYKLRLKISKGHKFIFVAGILCVLSYFVFISTARNTVQDRTKLEIYSSINSLEYSADFKKATSVLPSFVEDFFVDYLFYFSHEIFMFAEWYAFNDVKIIDVKLLQFSPFIERQVDRLGLSDETQMERFENSNNQFYQGSIIKQGWPTTNVPLLRNTGYLGAVIIIFLHGFFSHKLYYLTKLNPNFGLINLSIANNIILFNTISNSAFSETQVLFYILVSFYLISKKI